MSEAERLLAAVYQEPNDLGLRAVYADSLSQKGDPRGELITLQLIERPSKEQGRRARELSRLHGHEWLGDLTPLFGRKNLVYRHGFPVSGQLAPRLWEPIHALKNCPAWATFEELDLFESATRQVGPTFLSDCRWRHLRVIRGLRLDNFFSLVASPEPWDAQSVTVVDSVIPRDDRELNEAALGEGLPLIKTLNLKKLVLTAGLSQWFQGAAFWQTVRNIHLALTPPLAIGWAPALELVCRRPVETLVTIDCYPWSYRLEHTPERTTLKVTGTRSRSPMSASTESLGLIVAAFSFRLFDEIHVRLNARRGQAATLRDVVVTSLRRFEDRLRID